MIPDLQSIFTLLANKISGLTSQIQRLFAKSQKNFIRPLESLLVLGPSQAQAGQIKVLYSEGETLQNANQLINFICPKGAQLSECEEGQTLLNTYYQKFQVRFQDFIVLNWNQRNQQSQSLYLYGTKFKWVYNSDCSLFASYTVVFASRLSCLQSVGSLCMAVLSNLKYFLLTNMSLDRITRFQELVSSSRFDREQLYRPIALGESHLLTLPPEFSISIALDSNSQGLEVSFSLLLAHILTYFPFSSLLACLERILLDFRVCLFSLSQARVTQTVQWVKLCLQRCNYLGRVVSISSKQVLYGLAHCPVPLLFGCSLTDIYEFQNQELVIIRLDDQIQKPSRQRKLFSNDQSKSLSRLYGEMQSDLQMQGFLSELGRAVEECNQRGYPEFWLDFRQTLSFKNRGKTEVQR